MDVSDATGPDGLVLASQYSVRSGGLCDSTRVDVCDSTRVDVRLKQQVPAGRCLSVSTVSRWIVCDSTRVDVCDSIRVDVCLMCV